METLLEKQIFITKRNGEVVDFNSEKIKTAIKKAVVATKTEIIDEKLDKIVIEIVNEIKKRFIDFYPNVENIQDIVEKHLVDNDLYVIAKEYILYRAKSTPS